jgi:hypothetical protein
MLFNGTNCFSSRILDIVSKTAQMHTRINGVEMSGPWGDQRTRSAGQGPTRADTPGCSRHYADQPQSLGVNGILDTVGDEVLITIDVEMAKPDAAK